MIITVPSLQGTLAKRAKPMLQPNFTKEPFRPSRSNVGLRDSAQLMDKQIENINRQCLTANKSKLGKSGVLKVCTFNQNINGLIGKWLRNPSLLLLATR
jgi:hypothetical protein